MDRLKIVILAGGFGTRLAEYTDTIPKPMVEIGGKPIIWHIMQHYSRFGFTDFVIALGYKAEVLRDYFLNFKSLNSNFSVNLNSGAVSWLDTTAPDWTVTLVDTGINSLTGTRLGKLRGVIGDERFMLTYGDGLSNVDLNELITHHEKLGCIATVTAVRPPAKFGEMSLQDDVVDSFQEKPQLDSGWINGGFFVFEPGFFDYIPEQDVMLERDPLTKAVNDRQLAAYQHLGFWQSMDTKRDRDVLQALWDSGAPPWMI